MIADHGGCADVLRSLAADDGTEIIVSAAPPLIASRWIEGYTCPHGVTFWIEPTSEQRIQWIKDGES